MRTSFAILFFLLSAVAPGQSNKGQVDGGLAFGYALPLGEHLYHEGKALRPTQFAEPGYSFHMDAHAGIGSGWKIGLAIMAYHAGINEKALTQQLLSNLYTNGYYVTVDPVETGYYESFVFSMVAANDIRMNKWLLTPHAGIGFTSLSTSFNCSIDMKEIGTNYSRSTFIAPKEFSSLDPVVSFGVRIGREIDWFGSKLCIFAMAEHLRYSSTMGLRFSTTDIFQNEDVNDYWYTGDVQYIGFMIGGSCYIR